MQNHLIRLPVEGDSNQKLQILGGKGMSLNRLIIEGFPVPETVVLTSDAYRLHLAQKTSGNNLQKKSGNTNKFDESGSFIKYIMETPLIPEIALAIQEIPKKLRAECFAVRSSATAEDMRVASFAGQYESKLNVKSWDLENAVKMVWASLWSTHALQYREKHGLCNDNFLMAVVIQPMIQPDVSGVLFTKDPVSGRDSVIIEAVSGHPELLVSGRVTPDRFTVLKNPLSVETVVLGNENNKNCCLLNEEAIEISRLGLEMEKRASGPLDIEWCIAGKKSYILQSRPVSTGILPSSWEDRQIWTNVNAAEIIPDVITPMTWSIVEPMVQQMLVPFFEMFGVHLKGHVFLHRVAGRAYFSLNTIIACIRHIPGMKGKGVTEMFGGQTEDIISPEHLQRAEAEMPVIRFSMKRFISGVTAFIWRFLVLTKTEAEQILARVKNEVAEQSAIKPGELGFHELTCMLRRTVQRLCNDQEAFNLFGMGKMYDMSIYNVCKDWFKDMGHSKASRMLAGLGSNDNAQAGLDLWQLAQSVDKVPLLKEIIFSAVSCNEVFSKISCSIPEKEFAAAWERFMSLHGHHCRGEIEVINPRWAETPDVILEQLKSCLTALPVRNFEEHYREIIVNRKREVIEVLGQLRNPLKRMLLRFLLYKNYQCAPFRESLKSEFVKRIYAIRRMVLEVGNRFVQNKFFDSPDNIFFLHLHEIDALTEGKVSVVEIKQLIAARKAEYAENNRLVPPAVVIGKFDPLKYEKQSLPDGKILRGVAVNPGIVTGPARVILRSGDDQVKPGEILVAPFTDPGWVPYFLNAAAIVMDVGGILSHGSIVAREFGIPAVVNVGSATKIIKTGQIIKVDGSSGIVWLQQ